jgi:hypothetical protein
MSSRVLDSASDFLAKLKLPYRDLAEIVHSDDMETTAKLKTICKTQLSERETAVGNRSYTELDDGWYLRNAARGTLTRISSVVCHILRLIHIKPLDVIYYECRIKQGNAQTTVFLHQNDFEMRLLKTVSGLLLTKFLDVVEIKPSEAIFRQLTHAFSHYQKLEITAGCGWNIPSESFILPNFQIHYGQRISMKTPFPDNAPASQFKFNDSPPKINPEIFFHFQDFMESAVYLMADILKHLVLPAVTKCPQKTDTLVVTDTMEHYLPLYSALTKVMDASGLNGMEDYQRLHKWACFLDARSLPMSKVSAVLSPAYPFFGQTIVPVPVSFGIIRVIFGQTNLLFLNNLNPQTMIPQNFIQGLSQFWIQALTDLSADVKNLTPHGLMEFCLDAVAKQFGISAPAVGKCYVSAGPDMNPDLFADMLRFIQYTETFESDDLKEMGMRLRINKAALAKAVGKMIGFYSEETIVRLLDKTNANLSFRNHSYFEVDLEWYQERRRRADAQYHRYLTYF